MYENASFQGYFTEVGFDTSEGNQLSYFQNGYFSKILWWFHEPHNQVKCRYKDLKSSELFTIKIFGYRIVTFLPAQSLLEMECMEII